MSRSRLGPNRYGKAETHVVRVTRDGDVHHIRDLTVSVALSGAMEAVHLTGDNSAVLTTDTQKNTVFAFARKHGVDSPEGFGLLLARHFVGSQPSVDHARVSVEEHLWDRIGAGPHSFVRRGGETRTALIHHDATATHVVSGIRDLVVLNSTDSEFWGYVKDEYTTLPETRDRILATEVTAQWRHTSAEADWEGTYPEARRHLLEAFAGTYSLSLQQTLYAMGDRLLDGLPEVCEVRLSLPNRHHFTVDLEPFGLDNDNEVFYAADRPYGLIEGAVVRDGAPDAGAAWT
ncbi:factor-independent urate hydroxylase [Actinoallomurus iriomotensis]|uniref:Uricase n=1 Tax=Actinoallomurus iriomotensis TaxID=478107 RepID=A0A9W6RV54_9ACTN|nr:urate oxidase [Actinoallomurus iriomotensis]GLY82243.1 uricase [Actinoallomurus iriomotensis]